MNIRYRVEIHQRERDGLRAVPAGGPSRSAASRGQKSSWLRIRGQLTGSKISVPYRCFQRIWIEWYE